MWMYRGPGHTRRSIDIPTGSTITVDCLIDGGHNGLSYGWTNRSIKGTQVSKFFMLLRCQAGAETNFDKGVICDLDF